MDITSINKKIRNEGFEKLTKEEKIFKIKNIWQKRNEKNQWGGKFKNIDNFIKWYLQEPRVCACCGIEEDFVRKYFYESNINNKMTRNNRRGHMLELDKIDNKLLNIDEKYTEDNCQLLCYPCNNAKSNLCNDNFSFEPIAKGIKEFWKNQK